MLEADNKISGLFRDSKTNEFVVTDELDSFEVVRTPFLEVAEFAIKWYSDKYLTEKK